MNKNLTPIILIVLALGIYFTFTRSKMDELKSIKAINTKYEQAIANSEKLVKVRDKVREDYNKIDIEDRENLEKMLPDNVDNVRLIIDINGVGARHGLPIKNIKTTTGTETAKNSTNKGSSDSKINQSSYAYDTVTVSFSVATSYEKFIDFLRDLEASLRIMDISKITLKAGETGVYEYGVELKTYWLRQN